VAAAVLVASAIPALESLRREGTKSFQTDGIINDQRRRGGEEERRRGGVEEWRSGGEISVGFFFLPC
jgi:hypothetical protein